MKNFRLYSNIPKLHLITVKENINDIIDIIEPKIFKEDAIYTVIEHNFDLNMDVPIKIIYGVEDFLTFKEENTPINKVKTLKN